MALALLATPFLAAVTLSPPSLLPGDDTPAPAAGSQFDPVLVEGDGTTWLVVW